MSRVYKNPPLIEAICAFQFEPGQAWDWTVPGLFYARIRDEFPERAEQQMMQVGFGAGQSVSPPTMSVSRVQFLRKDRTALIQVGPNVLTVNHLSPYPTWEQFREIIFRNLDLYVEIAQPNSVTSINLRYINRIEVPGLEVEKGIDIGDYMVAVPGVPHQLLREPMSQFIQRVEIPMSQAGATLILQSGSLPPEREGVYSFLLDLEVVTNLTKPVSFDHVRDWVTQAHSELNGAFEACITDQLRQLFEE